MWEIIAVSCVVVFLAAVICLLRVRVVGHGKCMVLERFGRFTRVVYAGVHFLPFETPKRYKWTFTVSDNAARGGGPEFECISGYKIELNNGQIDCLPSRARTNDGVIVTVDGTLHYKIVDPMRAVYETPDLLNFLEECIAQATRVVCSQKRYDDLCGQDYEMAAAMVASINEQSKAYGVECSKFMIQSITASDVIEKSTQSHIAKQKEADARLNAMRQESMLAEMKTEHDKSRQKERLEMETIERAHKTNMTKMECDAEYHRVSRTGSANTERIRELLQMGMTERSVVQLMYAEAAKGKDRVIICGGNGMGSVVYPAHDE